MILIHRFASFHSLPSTLPHDNAVGLCNSSFHFYDLVLTIADFNHFYIEHMLGTPVEIANTQAAPSCRLLYVRRKKMKQKRNLQIELELRMTHLKLTGETYEAKPSRKVILHPAVKRSILGDEVPMDDFRDFLNILNEKQVEYLIVGGWALGIHGYVRATGDMDIWIGTQEENLDRLLSAMEEFESRKLSRKTSSREKECIQNG